MTLVPSDILFSILINLSVKSLLRFQSISKSWNTIISDDKFKKAHCDESRALGRFKFLLRRSVYTNDVDKIDFVEWKNPQIIIEKQQLPLSSSHAICSHDGLVLLYTHKAYDTFVLWNPSIRRHKIYVCPYLNDSSLLPNTCGLCYDSTTDDYKIILIYKSFYLVCYANTNFWTMKKTLLILEQSLEDLKIEDSWFYDECCESITDGISTKGCVYWSLDNTIIPTQYRHIWRSKGLFQHVRINSTIIRFNAKSDELEVFPTPDFIGEMDLYLLSALNGCLGLYGGNMESNFWIMKQDEWKLLVKIGQIKPCVRSNKVLYCTKDGKVIFYKLVQHLYSNFGPSIQARSVTTFRPLANHLLEFEYHDQACLDSLSFPRLDPHAQD